MRRGSLWEGGLSWTCLFFFLSALGRFTHDDEYGGLVFSWVDLIGRVGYSMACRGDWGRGGGAMVKDLGLYNIVTF
jgi:hypothetical protein